MESANLKTIFSDAFPGRMYVLGKFHRDLFIRAHLTIRQLWIRLAQNRAYAITWTNDDLVQWHIHALECLIELSEYCTSHQSEYTTHYDPRLFLRQYKISMYKLFLTPKLFSFCMFCISRWLDTGSVRVRDLLLSVFEQPACQCQIINEDCYLQSFVTEKRPRI